MTLSWKSLGWLRGGRGHCSLIKTLLSFSVTISGGTLQNCQRSAISDLQKQHSLVSLFRILLYFSAQQPDHVIPLPENVLLPSWSAPNKIQAPGLGLLRGPAGPGPCLASPRPRSPTAHSVSRGWPPSCSYSSPQDLRICPSHSMAVSVL